MVGRTASCLGLTLSLPHLSQSHPNGPHQGVTLASGSHPEVGGAWALRVLPGPSSGGAGGAAARAARAHFLGLVLDEEEHIARTKDILRNGLIAGARSRCVVGGVLVATQLVVCVCGWDSGNKHSLPPSAPRTLFALHAICRPPKPGRPPRFVLPNEAHAGANLAALQLTATVADGAPATFDVVFTSRADDGAGAARRRAALSGAVAGAGRRLGGRGWVVWAPLVLLMDVELSMLQLFAQQPLAAPLLPSPNKTGDALTTRAAERAAAFDEKFDRVFPLRPLEGAVTGAGADAEQTRAVARAALSNLLGSMGYFVGESLVALPRGRRVPAHLAVAGAAGADGRVAKYWRAALFTATPSRSFFPRGFLWDEGFHQLLAQRWDARLSRDVMAHWLDLLNSQGWVPREQILGAEARARVPPEFVVQHPSHANPPSLFLPVAEMAARLEAHDARAAAAADGSGDGGGAGGAYGAAEAEAARAWLRRAWPRLEAWYAWFDRTQAGRLPGSFRCALLPLFGPPLSRFPVLSSSGLAVPLSIRPLCLDPNSNSQHISPTTHTPQHTTNQPPQQHTISQTQTNNPAAARQNKHTPKQKVARPQRDDRPRAQPQDAHLGPRRLPARVAPLALGAPRRPALLDGVREPRDGRRGPRRGRAARARRALRGGGRGARRLEAPQGAAL